METKEIPIKNVEIIENSRTRTDESDLTTLMRDIKENGLLHPIGVYQENDSYILLFGSRRLAAFKKLGYKQIPATIFDEKPSETELIALNTSENVQREDLKPHELGRVCSLLKQSGMNVGEISVRLGITSGRVKDVLKIYEQLPKELQKDIENVKNTANIEGKISVTHAKRILAMRLDKEKITRLMRYVKQNKLSEGELSKFDGLLRIMSFDDALKNIGDVRVTSVKIVFKKSSSTQLFDKLGLTVQEYVAQVLKGEIKPAPYILY